MRGRKSSGRTVRVTRVPKVRRQFLIAVVMIWQTHWSWQSSLSVRASLSYTAASRPESRVFYASVKRFDDVASMRLMNESTLDSAHARFGSISLFPNFPVFFPPPRVFRYATSIVYRQGRRENFSREIDPMVFVFLEYWNIGIIRYVDPIWSKMKEQLWFTIARHWLRYLFALCIDRSTSLVAVWFIP